MPRRMWHVLKTGRVVLAMSGVGYDPIGTPTNIGQIYQLDYTEKSNLSVLNGCGLRDSRLQGATV